MQRDLQITQVRSVQDLAPFIEGWRCLASGAPMRSPEWLLGWWKNYAAPGNELSVLLFHVPGGDLVGLAPLYLEGAGGRGIFRILGSADRCSHHTNWLSAAGWEERVGHGVARFLIDCRAEWKRLVFQAVDEDASAVHATVEHLAEYGFLRHRRQIHSCWKIALPETWDDYLGLLSRSLRKRCRKLQRDFLDSGKIRIREAATEEELEEGFGILLKLHAARWGSSGKPLGVFDDPRFRRFHEKVSREMLARNNLRLAWLECEGRPIAIEYQFFDAGSVYAYQAGLDLIAGEYSPGKLSMMAAIRFAIDRGCTFFDFLGGDEPYKANWRAVPAACHDLRVWPRDGRGRLEWTLWNGYTASARRLKQVIPQPVIERGLGLFNATKEAFRTLRGMVRRRSENHS